MRVLQPALKAHIDTGATTLCRCWRVTRRDGTVLGFTEHDADLTVDHTRFLAASGFSASEAETALGLAAPNGEVAGAFSSEAIADSDLERGRYDGARVEVLLVNWADPAQFLLEHVREIGEVTRTDNSFRAELRGLAARLDQPTGRVYGRRCDARLGDGRCGVSLAAFKAMGEIVAADTLQASVSGISGFASGWFAFGVLTFTSGTLAAVQWISAGIRPAIRRASASGCRCPKARCRATHSRSSPAVTRPFRPAGPSSAMHSIFRASRTCRARISPTAM